MKCLMCGERQCCGGDYEKELDRMRRDNDRMKTALMKIVEYGRTPHLKRVFTVEAMAEAAQKGLTVKDDDGNHFQ